VDENSPRYEGWRVALASAVGVLVSFASVLLYSFSVLLKPLTEEFSWSREAVSSAFGLAAVMAALSSPLLGYFFDRISARRIIVPCLATFGGAFAALSLTSRLWQLYVIFGLLGLVANGTSQMAYSRTVAGWFDQRRGLALSLVLSGGAVGAMVVPPAADALIRRLGWRGACVTIGVLVLAIGLPTVVGFVRERPEVSPPRRPVVRGASLREGLKSRVFWILVTVLVCSSIAKNGAVAHLASLLTDRGESASRAAIAVSAVGGASLIGRLLTGWLLDRFFAARVSFALLTLAALGTFLLSDVHSFGGALIAAVLIGFGMGGEADVTPYLLTRYFGFRAFSSLYGFTWTAYALAGAVGPILMGRVFDTTGSYEAVLVKLAFGTFAVAMLMLCLPAYHDRSATLLSSGEVQQAMN
jgi:MFS family permease